MSEPDIEAPRDSWTAKLMRVASILKKRFPNLTVEETIDLSGKIVAAVSE